MKEHILSYLPGDHPWQNQIYCYDCVASTNDLAKQMARDGAPNGTTVIADSQTGGRGRMGRSFHSPSGSGIYMSVLLRPNCPASDLMHLTCAVAVAACDALESAIGLRPGIKWTNDLVHNSRKLGGILTELALDPKSGAVDYAIIGIGINCTQQEDAFPEDIRHFAGSLTRAAGKPVNREKVAAALIQAFSAMDLRKKAEILRAYRANCITLGKDISILRGDDIQHGTALDIDESGALLVQFPDGHRETVSSGEVSIRGMYGYV